MHGRLSFAGRVRMGKNNANKPFSPVCVRAMSAHRWDFLTHISLARVRTLALTAVGSVLVSGLLLSIAFPGAMSWSVAWFSGAPVERHVLDPVPASQPVDARVARLISAQRTEFLRVHSLIQVVPERSNPEARPSAGHAPGAPEQIVLRVREEFLVGVFGNQMQHGFKRFFHSAEPMQRQDGSFGLGPGLNFEILEASRRALPVEMIERWEPLVDSNERLNLPVPVKFSTTVEKQPTGTAIALGKLGDPLKSGVYVYRLDYLVHGAVLHPKEDTRRYFSYTPFQPLGLPVSEFDLSVDLSEVGDSAATPELMVRAYSLEPQAPPSPDDAGSVQVIYRDAWTAKGQVDSPLRFVSSKIDPAAGLQIAVRW